MKHCPSCGTQAAREEQPDRAAGSCPRCEVEMFLVKVGNTTLNECRKCGGLWVDNSSFQKICEDRQEQERVLGISVTTPENPLDDEPGKRMYVPCPVCKKLMNRLNFGGSSAVIIDWCKEHGTWLDNDELRQIVTFIHGGGLKKARARENEKLVEETRRLRRELAAKHLPINLHSANWKEEDDPSLLDFLSTVWKTLSK